jgi:hypothetical protein
MKLLLAAFLGLFAAPALAADTITLESLLKEMTDREVIARFPDPAYTCKQFSSYDRRSTTPDDPKTWFANGDVNNYLRTEEVKGADGKTHKEWVMADMDGPGAVVRIWSANPAGTLRIYLDNAETPVIEAPMDALLGGKWKVGAPLSQECSKGWNLYLPIPYAKHCKITSDKDGFYYHVNYRTYEAGARVESLSAAKLADVSAWEPASKRLVEPRPIPPQAFASQTASGKNGLQPGATDELMYLYGDAMGPAPSISPLGELHGAVDQVSFYLERPATEQDLRSIVVTAEFDGEDTIWVPLTDFFGLGVASGAEFQDWYRCTSKAAFRCNWIMPFRRSAHLRVTNLGANPVYIAGAASVGQWQWDSRSMHFHANWHYEFPIHAYGARGTKDWNYIEAQGKGVYVGDTLAVMNPVKEWWGEGDEKIYVDGEKFPSHFGTGTEDYYGYAWCWPVAFQHPFHAQPRVDGNGKDNWGHTTVTRVRSLDAIPFTKSLKFDMEIWHWRECDEAYAATTYWYALPGATSNIKPDPESAAKPIPQPPPRPAAFRIKDAIECETMDISAKTENLPAIGQDMETFGRGKWSGESQLWVQGAQRGDFIELKFPAPGPRRVILYASKSWDYGIIQFSINGKKAGEPRDLCSGQVNKCIPTGPIDLGVFEPGPDGKMTLRAEVVGSNVNSTGTKCFFGLDCVVLQAAQ